MTKDLVQLTDLALLIFPVASCEILNVSHVLSASLIQNNELDGSLKTTSKTDHRVQVSPQCRCKTAQVVVMQRRSHEGKRLIFYWVQNIFMFTHSVVCFTTDPQPFPSEFSTTLSISSTIKDIEQLLTSSSSHSLHSYPTLSLPLIRSSRRQFLSKM